ncbi:MAG: hypothetical protein OEY67_09140 [Gammaproteobacteria bacterium]|nr:hypothetical protein [Gammaproteobacteria bacterium]
MALTEKEQKEFNNMVIACGRSPGDFQVTVGEGKEETGRVTVENQRLGRKKNYLKDGSSGWIIQFATDLKLGEM